MENPVTPAPHGMNDKDKLFAAIAYLGPISLVSLFLGGDSKFVKFHAKQGLALFIVGLVVRYGLAFLLGALFFAGPGLGTAYGISTIFMLVNLAWLIASIMGIVKAVQGEEWSMPVIADLAKKF